MTRQQAGVSAAAFADEMVDKLGWKLLAMCKARGGAANGTLTWPEINAAIDEIDEEIEAHRTALATAPPEQDNGVAQEEAQLLARYDKALQTQQAAPKLHGTFTIADLPEDQPQGIMPFDLNDWKRRFAYNSEAAERNSSMDSGWSARTADDCLRRAAMLWRELAIAIAKTGTKPEDLFDRPDLVDVQEAARFATTPIKEEHGRC